MSKLLYNKNTMIGRLYIYFSSYFVACTKPTSETLFMVVLAIIALESAVSVRFLHTHFLSKVTCKSLNAFYYALKYAKVDHTKFEEVTVRLALSIIPDEFHEYPVFLCIDDTMVEKAGQKFEFASKLFDHAAHNGSNYLNGHCFVSLMICVPVWDGNNIIYNGIPLGYRMWTKKTSKLESACAMVQQAMSALSGKSSVVLMCDSWYAKKSIFALTSAYGNLEIICNVRKDTALFDLPPLPNGKRGRNPSKGRRLSVMEDFPMTVAKINGYHLGHRMVMTNLLKGVPLHAYVTSPDTPGSCRLFLASTNATDLLFSPEWISHVPADSNGNPCPEYAPLAYYSTRWNIEVSYYEQKTFWSFCHYMVRSRNGIERMVNLINISYSSTRILPYMNSDYIGCRKMSAQEFRFKLSGMIHEQLFLTSFMGTVESAKNSKTITNKLKQLIWNKLCAA